MPILREKDQVIVQNHWGGRLRTLGKSRQSEADGTKDCMAFQHMLANLACNDIDCVASVVSYGNTVYGCRQADLSTTKEAIAKVFAGHNMV